MKQYLLKKFTPEAYHLAASLEDAGMFIRDKHFVAVHLRYDPKHLISSVNNNENLQTFVNQSDLILGFLVKKSIGSVQTLRKSYGIADDCNFPLDKMIECPGARDLHCRNAPSLLVRLELYVPEQLWRAATLHQRQMLTCLVAAIEARMPSVLKAWNKVRLGKQRAECCVVAVNSWGS
jgi:hypothetical protein